MKIITTLITLLFGIISMVAQANYKNGYIISNNNDTIVGLIDFNTDFENSKQCKFKLSDDANTQTFYPGDIKAYMLTDNGFYYVSHNIIVDSAKQTLFLQFLVKGMMNLYYYVDKNEISYYLFEDSDGETTQISRKPERIENLSIINDNKYIGILRYTFREFQNITSNLDEIPFNQKSMIEITKKYHEAKCPTDAKCIVYEKKKPNENSFKSQFSVYVGVQNTTYTFNYESKDYSYDNASPIIGGQMNIFAPRWSNSFSLQIDASLSQMKKKTDTITSQSEKHYYDYNTLITSFRLGFKYTYPGKKIKPTVEIGGMYSWLLKSKAEKISYSKYYPDPRISDYDLRSSFLGYYAAIGVDYSISKKSSLFLRLSYEGYISPDSSYTNADDKLKTPHIKLGYTF